MKRIPVILILIFSVLLIVACQKTNPSQKPIYQITFANQDGEVLAIKNYEDGEIPDYTYEITDTEDWVYTFEGWRLDNQGSVMQTLPKVTKDLTYYAKISQMKQKYTVSFISNGGSLILPISAEYGENVIKPKDPTKDGFTFIGWTLDSALTQPVNWPLKLTSNMTLYASWNEKVNICTYLKSLLDSYQLNPYKYIPNKMKVDANLISQANIVNNYGEFVNISDIIYDGYGEQWQMVLNNLEQSKSFFNVLSIIEGLSTTSIVAFNNYLDSNPSNENQYEFNYGIYKVIINYDNTIISYVLEYTGDFPIFGHQSVQIALTYNIETLKKTGRVQIGDANAIKYEVTEKSYKFAIKYLGVRRAYFEIKEKQDGIYEGAIFEYLTTTVNDKELAYKSAAQFLITNDYVSVVGNKADGTIDFSNTINELYSTNTGQLLGYEIRESISVLGTIITYNTLWFNLNEQTGINSIRVIKVVNDKTVININGSELEFKSKLVGGLSLKSASRRYDIEFRTQYLYYRNTENNIIAIKIQVPMLFVQEEQLTTFGRDIKENNSQISNFTLTVSGEIQAKIMNDYDTMIDIFLSNKESVTSEDIIAFISTKV